MAAAENPDHFGEWVRKEIERLGIKKSTAAARMGIAAVTLRAWFGKPAPGVASHNRVQLAKLIGKTREEIDARLLRAEMAVKRESSDKRVFVSSVPGAEEAFNAEFYPDLKIADDEPRNGIEWIGPVHLFELSLAAGAWTDISEVEGVFEPQAAAETLFRVRLAGDSMMPAYRDGQVVVFQRVNLRPQELPIGRDFYVQRDNGLATFKRLEKVTKAAMIFRPLNVAKYPNAMTVERDEVRAVAMAVAKEPMT